MGGAPRMHCNVMQRNFQPPFDWPRRCSMRPTTARRTLIKWAGTSERPRGRGFGGVIFTTKESPCRRKWKVRGGPGVLYFACFSFSFVWREEKGRLGNPTMPHTSGYGYTCKSHRRCFGSGRAAAMALQAACSGIINTR